MMGKKTGILKRFVQDFYLVLILVFLYAPIATMTVLSFNSSKSRTQWGGFTTRWYTAVSYTHLDVYKRQVHHRTVVALHLK